MKYNVNHTRKTTDGYEHNKTDEEYEQEIRKLKQRIQELEDMVERQRKTIDFNDEQDAEHVAWLKQHHQQEMKNLRKELQESNEVNLLRAIHHEQETNERLREENKTLRHLLRSKNNL